MSSHPYLDYARRQPRIKGVVLKLSSPGGGAASSEALYLESRKLREEKPLVMVMDGLVASGGYMMAMGATIPMLSPHPWLGKRGGDLLCRPGPSIRSAGKPGGHRSFQVERQHPPRMDWDGGPAKAILCPNGDNRAWKSAPISEEELLEGRLYAGVEAVQLGLAAAIGNDSDAIERVADMAGISNYELVDINVEVDRLFIQKIRRIYAASSDAEPPADLTDVLALMTLAQGQRDPVSGLNPAGL